MEILCVSIFVDKECSLVCHLSPFHAFLSFPFLSLLVDVLSLPPDLHTYEFESGGPPSSGQSMGRLRQSIGFWESIGAKLVR